MKNGIDISKHNGNIDWSKVKTDFVCIRAGYGKEISQKDPKFEQNYSGCKKYNIPCGVYWYSYAMTVAEAKQEANVCLQVIKGKNFKYPIWLDMEESKQIALGMKNCTAIAEAFLSTIANAGYKCGIYTFKSFLENGISDTIKNKYDVWLSHVGKDGATLNETSYSGKYSLWQYSWTGRMSGISGDVDMSHCYVDYVKPNNNNNTGYVHDYKQGETVVISDNAQLFASAESTKASRIMKKCTMYIYDGICCKNGRYRVTSRKDYCGKKPAGNFVTGYISIDKISR